MYSKPVPVPSRLLDPWVQWKYWAAHSNLSVSIIPPDLGSVLSYSLWDQDWGILCAEFYFQGYIVLIGIVFRMIFANWYCKAPLPSPAAVRCKGFHMDEGSGSPAQGCTADYKEMNLAALDLQFSAWKILCVSEMHFADLDKECKAFSQNKDAKAKSKWALDNFLSGGYSNLHTVRACKSFQSWLNKSNVYNKGRHRELCGKTTWASENPVSCRIHKIVTREEKLSKCPWKPPWPMNHYSRRSCPHGCWCLDT